MRRAFAVFCMVVVAAAAGAQSSPALHSRSEATPDRQTQSANGYSTLPDDASGEYELGEKGSVVQITIEHNRLMGYITKMEEGTALTLFFDHAAVNGNHVSFTTKTVHGLRYSFRGAIVRGDAISSSMTGFYRLAGEMKVVRGNAYENEQVSLKSTPRDTR